MWHVPYDFSYQLPNRYFDGLFHFQAMRKYFDSNQMITLKFWSKDKSQNKRKKRSRRNNSHICICVNIEHQPNMDSDIDINSAYFFVCLSAFVTVHLLCFGFAQPTWAWWTCFFFSFSPVAITSLTECWMNWNLTKNYKSHCFFCCIFRKICTSVQMCKNRKMLFGIINEWFFFFSFGKLYALVWLSIFLFPSNIQVRIANLR